MQVDRSKLSRDTQIEDEPISLHVFVEQHGRITSIGLAGDTGQLIHTDAGLLDQVVYDNGYTDYYTYWDNDDVIEVTRENDQGVTESVFTFDFIRGTGAKWDAPTNTTIRRVFDFLDASFYERLVFTEFKRQKQATISKSSFNELINILETSACVCRFGGDPSCEKQNKNEKTCVEYPCNFRNKKIHCVWRGNAF